MSFFDCYSFIVRVFKSSSNTSKNIVPFFKTKYQVLLAIILALFFFAGTSHAEIIELSLVASSTENPLKLSLSVDHAKKIAGMKVTITYDKTDLTFVKAEKSSATSSFLHVVNDKSPGKLIVVMASAKGVSGDNLALLDLEFKRNTATAKKETVISVIQVQVMSEALKEFKTNLPSSSF